MMKNDSVTIRPAVPGDAARLTEIAHRSKAYWGYPDSWIRAWTDELTMSPERIARSPTSVAVEADEVVGFWQIAPPRDGTAELAHLWVVPERMGRGVGRALLEDALRAAGALGAEAVEFDADPHAAAFYTRMGADVVGVTPAPMPGAEDRWLPRMRISLPPRPPGA